MRKILAAGTVLLMVAVYAIAGDRSQLYYQNESVYLWTDPDTGCNYIAKGGSSATLAPRIARDGKTHMGCGAPR